MGGIDTGWTFYTPYSSFASNTNVTLAIVGVFVAGFSSILTGFNFIVTVHRMRAPGMTWFRLPLFVWAQYATSLVMILGTPVVAITLTLVAAERTLHLGIFDPKIGGDPVLFQHLFWFYSHPAVYIMILPGMGVISELVAAMSRKQIFGYGFVAASSLAIAILGFLVWGHHLFVSSQSIYAGMVFSIITMLVAVPSAVKTFNWAATMYKGAVSWESPTFWVVGFMGLFLIGGLTGLYLAAMGMDIALHDTYFVVAHFHYIMVGGAIMAYMGGLHFWWPKMTGRMFNEGLAKAAAVLVFVGFNFTFFPQFILGYLGMPRRYYAYPDEFQVWNVLSSAGASVLGIGYMLRVLLHDVLALPRRARARESVGREGPGVDDLVAAADVQLRRRSDRHRAGLRLQAGGIGGHRWLTRTRIIRSSSTISTRWSSSSRRRSSGCGCSSSPKSCSSAACSWPTSSTATCTRWRGPRAATS